ncbi:hypothetical protein R1sor_013451 [Riccia sorocarpa]|uniref:Uncharacterized protein n=1 Tax=Riccia sorocarpa TaxID=122646 RepID=A0ABD3H975_9MARC
MVRETEGTERGYGNGLMKLAGAQLGPRGEWNSVETFEYSVGASPVQHGTEQRKWSTLVSALDLLDGWTEATQTCKDLVHIFLARSRMTDHYPIWIKVVKKAVGQKRKSAYFKANPETLRKTDVQHELKKRWEAAGQGTEDTRIRWELKWAATRKYLKDLHHDEKQKRKEVQIKLDEL